MNWSIKNEIGRKAFHLLSLFILLFYFLLSESFNKQTALIALVFVLVLSLLLEYIRLEINDQVPFLKGVWKYLRREKEKDRLGGEVYFLIGSIIALAVFDVEIAVMAILMATFGDATAALVGKKYGKHYLVENKSWEGTLAQFFVNLLVGFLVFIATSNGIFFLIVVLVMSLTATLTEALITKIDDNLLIPLFAGFDGQITLLLLTFLIN